MSAIPQQVSNLPVSFDPYLKLGWHLVPIAPGSKGPRAANWNRKENCITTAHQVPPGCGIGLAHAYSGTMALDIDEWDTSDKYLKERGISLQGLYDAPDAVHIVSGVKGHGKLLYAMPFGLALPSKKLIRTQEDGTKTNFLDFRCATLNGLTVQDVLPPSIHPITCQPYQFSGKGNWERLPLLPASLLSLWQQLLDADAVKSIKVIGATDASWNEIRAALSKINPDCNRDEWISVGMSLQSTQNDQALATWNEWSMGGGKYKGEADILNCWRSFKADGDIQIGTLFHIAKQYGYTRPMPDASSLFTSIAPQSPTSIIDSLRNPIPRTDLSLWPSVLATRVQELSTAIGCDPLVPLFAGLGAVCAAADSRIRLELMTDYLVPPVLWLMTIGAPADKKSPGSRPMLEPLKDIELGDKSRYKAELLRWQADEAAYASSMKAYLQASGAAEVQISAEDGRIQTTDLPVVHELPPAPVPLRLTVSDVTSQKLVRIVADRPRGVLCYLDEMNSWVNKLSERNSGEDRSCWVSGYEAAAYQMDRVGDGKGTGSTYCENFAIGVYGNIQPAVFRKHVDALSQDGLLQRFIPGILSGEFDRKPVDLPAMFSHKAEWEQLVRQVYALPPITYTLSPDARIEFDRFQQWYHCAKQDERLLLSPDIFMTAFGKLEGTTGRLALILHLMTEPYQVQVSKATIASAVQICKSYIMPALRYTFADVAGLIDEGFEVWVTRHIATLAGEVEQITLSEIRRSARRQLGHLVAYAQEQAVIDAMTILERQGWVAPVDTGLRQTAAWAINPAIAVAFKEYRVTTLKAKQRQNDRRTMIAGLPRQLVKGYDPATMDGE